MDTIVIVHPLKETVECLEQALKYVAEHLKNRGYICFSGQFQAPNIFEKYNFHRKAIILPGYENNLSLPDTSLLTYRIKLLSDDVVISDFNSYKSLSQYNYPDWDRVVEEVKDRMKPHGRIIVGGFACRDCVKDFAMACDSSGLPTFLDELTTDLYYDTWPHTEKLEIYNIQDMGEVISRQRNINSVLVRKAKL